MRKFMDDDFLLKNETAKRLFHEYAKDMPIFDFHNHLNAQEIYENQCYKDISQVWLGNGFYGDHYKWRIMRSYGIDEKYITGNASGKEKFDKWAEVLTNAIGNPLYHWTHLELKRYFGVEKTLNPSTSDEIWEHCNNLLQKPEFSTRNLLRMMNVKVLCTTDDPIDDLRWHKKLKEDGFEIKVLPAFRPDKALNIDKEGYVEYLEKLSSVTGIVITNLKDLFKALSMRIEYFHENGARISDHACDGNIYAVASEEEVDVILQKALSGKSLSSEEVRKYKGMLMVYLAAEYCRKGWTMQLHIGALRNNSTRNFKIMGADTGYDCMGDDIYMNQLSALLDCIDSENHLPKTILYCLNPRDNDMLVTLAGCFMQQGVRGKVQFGSAWWFCDQKTGMEKQLEALSSMGLLSCFVGMLTDSRSFLSFPRHEYFRRILCNKLGELVENGEYPNDIEFIGKMVQDICYNNAVQYFNCD